MKNHLFSIAALSYCILMGRIVTADATVAVSSPSHEIALAIKAKEGKKACMVLAVIGKQGTELARLAELVGENLSYAGHKQEGFDITLRFLDALPSRGGIYNLFGEGFPLVLFLSEEDGGKTINWRIYETSSVIMKAGKRSAKESAMGDTADKLSEKVLYELTGRTGVFSTRIAYCKEEKAGKRVVKNIYLAHPFTGSKSKPELLVRGGNLLAPRWNKDESNPLVLFSRCTATNVSLMAVDMNRKQKTVSNFDGLNMLPCFSADGRTVVYCLSVEGTSQLYSYEYDEKHKRQKFIRLTNNGGNNVSPCLCPNGDIIFCSDFESKAPQIYCLKASTKQVQKLSHGGFCASPSFCQAHGKIAYCAETEGVMQIFVYDPATTKHQQLTYDDADKEECSWSPCGTYLAFAVDNGKSSRIAVFNSITCEQTFITGPSERCTYPAWSGWYQESLRVI